jgi:hypothetical protein
MDKVEFKYEVVGLGLTEHNYNCAVCKIRPAVHDVNTGILNPCWYCMKLGYRTLWLSRFQRVVLRILGAIK